MQLDLDTAQASDSKPMSRELPARRIGKGKAIVVRPALVARIARRLPAADSPKEVVKRLLPPAQYLLQDMGADGRVLWSDITFQVGQRIGLIVVRHRILARVLCAPVGIVEVGMAAARIPRLFALLQGGVVEFATPCQRPVQRRSLRGCWVEAKFERSLHSISFLSGIGAV